MRTLQILLAAALLCGCDVTAAAPSREGRNHRVRRGESLFAIAEGAYGNGLEWQRIWDANPWIDPDHLKAGEVIYIPPRDPAWGDPPSRQTYSLDPGTGAYEGDEAEAAADGSIPGGREDGFAAFRNVASNVSSRTLFGQPLHNAFLVVLIVFLIHAVVQGILVWLAANITFVKEATFKKSMRAVFLTESMTFSTLLVLGGIAIVAVCLGGEAAADSNAPLFPSFESFLRSPTGMGVVGLGTLALYVVLSLRFIPQVFGVPVSRAMALMALAVLIPHLAGLYLVGQRAGIIR